MIAILLVLCLLPVTGLAFSTTKTITIIISDISAFSGSKLIYRDTSKVGMEYSCANVDAFDLVKAYAEMVCQRESSYQYSIDESADGSFTIWIKSKDIADFSQFLIYYANTDSLTVGYWGPSSSVDSIGTNFRTVYKYHYDYVDTGERYEPAAATPNPGTNATSKPGKTRCNTCDGTGRVEKDCSICGGDGYKDCSVCSGRGYYRCKGCDGYGNKTCPRCYGSGKDGKERCSKCGGKRTVRCGSCSSGKLTCSACNGRKEKKCTSCKNGKKSSNCSRCGGTGWR